MGGQLQQYCLDKKGTLKSKLTHERSSLGGSQFISKKQSLAQPVSQNAIEQMKIQVQFVSEKFKLLEKEYQQPLNLVSVQDIQTMKLIGRGSFGKVYLVRIDNEYFAMKQIKKKILIRQYQVENMFYEKHILLCHDHPFIVKLHYSFQDKVYINLIMDFISGGELFTHLNKRKKFDLNTVKFYTSQIILVFEYLHDKLNVIYRDLKPENILLCRDGYVKLTDFGLAKDSTNLCYSFCGTPEYLAPEVIKEEGHGLAVDIWTLGCFIYEMMFGQTPFRGRNRKDLFEQIKKTSVQFPINASQDAVSLISALLDKDPYKRPNIKAVKQHPFFYNVDFEKILKKQVDPPFIPLISQENDTRNFEHMLESTMKQTSKEQPTTEEDQLFKEFDYQCIS